MGDVINLAERLHALFGDNNHDVSHDQFLLDEGLELLAAYRLLDSDMRKALLELIKAMVKRQAGR